MHVVPVHRRGFTQEFICLMGASYARLQVNIRDKVRTKMQCYFTTPGNLKRA